MQLQSLLNRPPHQRLREYKHRCAQSIVFGVPVLFLQYFGHRLGGGESERWVAVLQALLSGWIIYVGAAGMLFEGMVNLRSQLSGDLLAGAAATVLYLYSVAAVLPLPFTGRIAYRPLLFHLSVLVIATWTAIQWLRFSRRLPLG